MKHEAGVNSAQFSPDGQRVVTASDDKTARLWDARLAKPIGEPMKHEAGVYSAQFSPDGQRVVTASDDKTARLWDALTGNQIGEPMKHEGAVNSAQFSPDGQRVVTASDDKTARLWDVPTTSDKDTAEDVRLLADLAEATGGVAVQAFGADGDFSCADSRSGQSNAGENRCQLRRAIFELTPLQRFLKWSVFGAEDRTISPFSDTHSC